MLCFLIACSKPAKKEADSPPPRQPKPLMHSFKIAVTEITANSAKIEWEPAVDFHLDSVSYSIKLDGLAIASGIRTESEFQLSQLQNDHSYVVEVKALHNRGDTVVSTTTFKTLKVPDGYLKYVKFISEGLTAQDVANAGDRGYLIVTDSSLYTRLKLIRVDSLGRVLWRKTFKVDGRESKIRGTNGGYLVMGYNYLMKVDSIGNLIWQTVIPTTGIRFSGFTQLSNQDIYIAASTPLPTGEGLGQPSIYKINNSGQVIWAKNYQSSLAGAAEAIIPSPDERSLLVTGNMENSGLTWSEYLSGGQIQSDFFVCKLDLDGNILWQKTYGDYRYDMAKTICYVGGDLLIGGISHISGGIKEYHLLRIDQNGSQIKDISVKAAAFLDHLRSIESTSDGGYLVLGTYGIGLYSEKIGIFKFNASDQKEWERSFDFGDSAAGAKQTWDGGFFVICDGGGLILLRLNPLGEFE